MKIVFLNHIYLLSEHKIKIESLGNVTFYEDMPVDIENIIDRVRNADIIIPNWLEITKNIIDRANKLKYIIAPTIGYDYIDILSAIASGIKVLNCPSSFSNAVAEHTLGLLLAVNRKIVESNLEIRNGYWCNKPYVSEELRGKSIGLIGQGSIGRRVGEIANCLGMKVSYANSKTHSDSLDTLIANVDFLSLHLTLNNKTRHLIDSRKLNLMKKSAYIINTSRGAIIDQKALYIALKDRKIAGAALDVFEQEPTGNRINQEIFQLAQLDNVVTTPHIAYKTEESIFRLGEELIYNIESCLTGQIVNEVNSI